MVSGFFVVLHLLGWAWNNSCTVQNNYLYNYYPSLLVTYFPHSSTVVAFACRLFCSPFLLEAYDILSVVIACIHPILVVASVAVSVSVAVHA